MIEVTAHIQIPKAELEKSFVLAGGPGGQNVDKLSTICRVAQRRQAAWLK
jgi:protein subunit release factor B